MKRKAFIIITLLACIAFAGCQRPETTEEENTPAAEVTDMEDLEDGGYYIYRNGTYERLYVQNANYDVEDSYSSSVDYSRTLWYGDDWSMVPTMYRGDMLIYKTSESLDENFALERFEYVGYTVGISNLTETASGRYSYTTNADDRHINPASDAMQLYDIPTETGIIDRIGGAYLRSGNISNGGCILGLEKDGVYEAEVYAGTYLHRFNLTADSIALTSMEIYQTVDYEFLQSEILCIHIPEYFNSGYYLVNNYGLVRYVNGSSYDADTDFNIPNVEPSETEPEETETAGEETIAADTNTAEEIVLEDAGTYIVTVTYEGAPDPVPTAVLFGPLRAFRLTDVGNNTLSLTQQLEAGTYSLEIEQLEGRTYTYDIEIAAEATQETEETHE